MANSLGLYNPLFYANEALIQLEKALGLAGRVHRGYEAERNSFARGDTINIRRPSTFTAQDAPSTAQNLNPDSVAIKLDHWKEVKFKLTDKDFAFTGQRIIDDHIRPASVAIADDIDLKLASLYRTVPWHYDLAGTTEAADITGPRKVMFDNKVPVGDANMVHYMIDGELEMNFLNLAAFSQQQGAGDQGVNTQRRGSLGPKFGMEVFANQNVQTHTAGDLSATDPLLAGAASKGDTTVTLDKGTLTGGLKEGDTFLLAGNTQRYAVTEDATASGNEITVKITPALVQDYDNDTQATVDLEDHDANLAFHRNFAALAIAPLPTVGNELGAKVATVTDPITGLSLRSRLYYVGDSSEIHVALDVLYGFQTLDPNLAVRGRRLSE